MFKTRSVLAYGSALLLSAGLLVAPTTAQAHRLPAPPRVTITVNDAGVHMPHTLRSQRYRFVVRTPKRIGVQLQLVKPDRGYTKREFVRDARLADRGSLRAIRRITHNSRFFGGSTAEAGRNGVFWETVYAGRYWAFNFAAPATLANVHTVRVHGKPRLTRWPGSDTRVTTFDYGFAGPRVLPRSGNMLIRNRMGAEPHFVVFARLLPGTSYADVISYLNNPQGPPPEIQEVMATPVLSNNVQYLQKYRFPRGRYALLCFFPTMSGPSAGAPHAFMGMHRKVVVR